MMTAVVGGVVASWIVSFLNTIFTAEQMRDYAWRIPFLSSLIVAIFGFITQHRMEQSAEFARASKQKTNKMNPIVNAIKHHWLQILLITFAVIPWCMGGYITYTFLPIYLEKQLGVEHSLLVSSFKVCYHMGCIVVGGIIADSYNYFVPLKLGAAIMCISSFPLYYLMNNVIVVNGLLVVWPLIFSDIIFGFALGIFGGPMQIFMVDCIDDVVVRYSAIGIAYNVGQAVFGGTAPLIGSALSLANLYYVGVYLAIFCGISAVILQFMQRQKERK